MALEAELRRRGESTEVTEPDGPRRWIRGTVAPADGALRLSVNSEERLERFCALLDGLGIPFEIARRDVIDPSLDMAPIRAGAIGAGSPPPEVAAAWLASWPDEPVPALGGLTPRQAAASDRERPYLEALLRDFEHAGDHERARGGRPADSGGRTRGSSQMCGWDDHSRMCRAPPGVKGPDLIRVDQVSHHESDGIGKTERPMSGPPSRGGVRDLGRHRNGLAPIDEVTGDR
nr:hypothetical protein [Conexibacter sp. DBS9H8]